MSKEFVEYIADDPKFNLIPSDKVSLIKIKLGKSHRKESDWSIIKDILSTHDLIVCEPKKSDRRLKAIERILVEDGSLIAFTNIDDCMEHIKNLNRQDNEPGRLFKIGAMSFDQVADVSEATGMDLYIDIQARANAMCMVYIPGEEIIQAIRVARY